MNETLLHCQPFAAARSPFFARVLRHRRKRTLASGNKKWYIWTIKLD